jgi:hypothetical protein
MSILLVINHPYNPKTMPHLTATRSKIYCLFCMLCLTSWLLCMLCLISCGIFGRQAKLDRSWPVKYGFGTTLSLTPTREGYIVKNDSDTQKGYIKMATLYELNYTITDVPVLPFNKTDKSDIINVKLEDIDFVRIKKSLNSPATEDYMPIESAMWQILGGNDKARVCYRALESNAVRAKNVQYTNQLALLADGYIIPMRAHSDNRSAVLLEFINERYGQDFQKKDFINEKAMIDLILKNEQRDTTWPIPRESYRFRH